MNQVKQLPGTGKVAFTSKEKHFRRLIKIAPWIGGAVLICFAIYFYSRNYFQDPSGLQKVIEQAGVFGPLLFIALTAFQVIVPIMPGGVSGALGMLCFGTWQGFFYSYIGVLIGSLILFFLVRRYGRRVILLFVKPKTYEKYIGWLNQGKRFDILFTIAIFSPIAPDDVLCMIAGLSEMNWKKFLLVLIVGKPVSMFLYSFVLVKLLALL